jgi:Mrp family chromosome partitioning ATPase
MNTLSGLLVEPASEVTQPDLIHPLEAAPEASSGRSNPVLDEQIRGLVQQLFSPSEGRVRHVGFSALERGTDTFQICLAVASALAETGNRDVGLIDAGLLTTPRHARLESEPDGSDKSQVLGPHLRLVPRWTWLGNADDQRIWDSSFAKLRRAAMEFDYSITSFDSLSWVTARLSQICDGLVLVLTANKTRRLVAAEVREQLRRMRIPVLGTVLAERRFPIPEGLYRRL